MAVEEAGSGHVGCLYRKAFQSVAGTTRVSATQRQGSEVNYDSPYMNAVGRHPGLDGMVEKCRCPHANGEFYLFPRLELW